MKAKSFYLFLAILAIAMLIAGCGSQPQAATPTAAFPRATPTESDLHQPVPTDHIKPGFTPRPTVILTPQPTLVFKTPAAVPDREYAKFVGVTRPSGKCEYCPLGTMDISEAKTVVDFFLVQITDVKVSRRGIRLFVEIPDGQNVNFPAIRPIWRALVFVDGKPIPSVSSGRDYAKTTYETTEYVVPAGADKIELQIVTGEISPVRFSIWFQFFTKS